MSAHYTAVLEIKKTTASPPSSRTMATDRDVVDVARIVIRSATLAGLREKIAAHAALIDEGTE